MLKSLIGTSLRLCFAEEQPQRSPALLHNVPFCYPKRRCARESRFTRTAPAYPAQTLRPPPRPGCYEACLREPQRFWCTAIVGPKDEFLVRSGAWENISGRETGTEGCKYANSSHWETLDRRQCEIFTQSAATSTCTTADVSSECTPKANSCAEFSH